MNGFYMKVVIFDPLAQTFDIFFRTQKNILFLGKYKKEG